MAEHILSRKTCYVVWAVMAALGIANMAFSFVPMGKLNTVVGIGIGAVQVALIILYYMHVRYESRLMFVFAIAGFCWLAILMTITFSDYFTRGWLPAPGELPPLSF